MAGVGVGGLFSSLINPGLDERIAQHLTPNPNPLAQQGQPPGSKDVDSLGNPVPTGQPPLAPAAVTQPDPVNASYIADLLKYQNNAAISADLNRNLEGVAAGFGTAQQQASKTAALARGEGVGGGLADLAGIQRMQDQTIADNEHSRFMANAAVFAQTLRNQGINVTDAQATEIMNNPGLLERFGAAAGGNATQTGEVKNADAATAEWARANPNATKQQIADYKANLIAGGMGGSDLEQRQYLAEKAAGLTTDDYPTWKAKHAAEATTLVTTAKDKAESKDAAVLDYPNIDANLSRSEDLIKKLLANKKATIDAINTMPSRKTGWWAANTPWGATEEVRTAAADIQTLMSTLAGEGLKNVKNVRNVREFNALADSLTAGLRPGNTDEGIETTLNDLLKKFGTTRAIAREQAGLPADEGKKDEPKGDGGTVKRRHYNEKGELVD
jgi:hypothetical protein